MEVMSSTLVESEGSSAVKSFAGSDSSSTTDNSMFFSPISSTAELKSKYHKGSKGNADGTYIKGEDVGLIVEEDIISCKDNDFLSVRVNFKYKSSNRPSCFRYIPRLWNNLAWYVLFHNSHFYIGYRVPDAEKSDLIFPFQCNIFLLKDSSLSNSSSIISDSNNIDSDCMIEGNAEDSDIPKDWDWENSFNAHIKLFEDPEGHDVNDHGIPLAFMNNSNSHFANLMKARTSSNGDIVKLSFRVELRRDASQKIPLGKLNVAAKYDDNKYPLGMAGLQNLGATCYLNSLLQMLFHVNAFRRIIYEAPFENQDLSTSKTLCLQKIFRSMQTSQSVVNTTPLLTAFGWTGADAFEQQDVQEMMRILLDKLEDQLKGTAVDGHIKKLFAGSVRSFIKCLNVKYESKREEDFYDIQLNVKGCKSVEESFKKYIEIELLNGENQYDADKFGKQDAEKGIIFTKFPPVLTILLKRFDFDMTTFRHMKLHDRFEFSIRMNLSEYLATDSPAENNTYLLHSVLVHIGDVGGGHYICFVRPSSGFNYGSTVTMMDVANTWDKKSLDPKFLSISECEKYRGKWFKFNDETVSQSHEFEAIELQYGRMNREMRSSAESAYMLVYVKEEGAGEIMKDITVEDIPSGLVSKLEQEEKLEFIERRRNEMRNIRRCIYYCDESTIENYNNFSIGNDLGFSLGKKINVLRGSSRLCVLFQIAKIMKVNPFEVKLYLIDKLKGRNVRVVKSLNYNELQLPCEPHTQVDAEFYYVRVAKGEVADNYVRSPEFQDVYMKETAIKDFLKLAMKKLLEFSILDSSSNSSMIRDENDVTLDDLIEMCGMGSNISAIVSLLSRDDQKNLNNMIETYKITNIAGLIFDSFEKDLNGSSSGKNQILTFFKLFDPYNIFASETKVVDQHKDKPIRSCIESVCLEESFSNYDDRDSSINDYFAEVNCEDYHPLKYLNYLDFHKCSESNLKKYCIGLLRRKFQHLPNVSSILSNLSRILRIYSVQDSTTNVHEVEFPLPIETDEEEEIEARQLFKLNGSINGFVVIDFSDPTGKENALSLLKDEGLAHIVEPKHNIVDFREWCHFRCNKFNAIFQPSSFMDDNLALRSVVYNKLLKWQKHASKSQNNTSISMSNKLVSYNDSDDEEDIDVHPLSGSDKIDEECAYYRDMGINLQTCGTFPLNYDVRRKLFLDYNFKDMLSKQYKVSDVIRFLSGRLGGVDVNRIMLYLSTTHIRQHSAHLSTEPLNYEMSKMLSDLVLERKGVLFKHNIKFYYKIIPYPLAGNCIVCELLLVDRSLRFFRQQFLNHLTSIESKPLSSNSGDSLTDFSVGSKRNTHSLDDANQTKRIRQTLDDNIENFEWTSSVAVSNSDIGGLEVQVYGKDDGIDSNAFFCSDYCVSEKLFVQVSRGVSVERLLAKVHSSVGIPSNLARLERWSSKCTPISSHAAVVSKVSPISIAKDNVESCAYVIFLIKNNQICDVVYDSSAVDELPSWALGEATLPSNCKVGIQLIDSNDCMLISGNSPAKRSMLVAVHNYTLLGQGCNISAIEDFGCPFVSYIMEGDDYASICRRFSEVSGDAFEDLMELKLALIVNKSPLYFPKPSESSDSQNSQNMNVSESSCGKIWDIMKEKHPNFAASSYSDLVSKSDSKQNDSRANMVLNAPMTVPGNSRGNANEASTSNVICIRSSSGLTANSLAAAATATANIITMKSKNAAAANIKIDLPSIGIQRSSKAQNSSNQKGMKIL